MDVLEAAKWYVSQGISVIPVKADGSKSPAISGWRKYSNELPDDATLEKWFGGAGLVGIGVPPGPASGNLVVLDFEMYGGESAYMEWLQRLPEELSRFARTLPTVSTPSGGKHIWIRLPESQPGSKLARYAGGKTKIEIRGEGHQVLAPGCPLECHSSGKLYDWINAPESFPEIELEQWLELVEWCCACNDYQAPEQPRDRDSRGTPAGQDSPGNDFNARGTWAETGLFDAGWTWCRKVGDDKGFLTRPEKDTGISASIGMVTSQGTGYPYLYVWSTSTDLAAETPYSRFAVYAHLKHGGDYSAAAKELMRLGYGERPGMSNTPYVVDLSGFSMKLGTPDGKPVYPFGKPHGSKVDGESVPQESRPFLWCDELSATEESAKWLWEGYLARGGITLFSALWKSGKSTMLAHLLKAFDGAHEEFLGQKIVPSKVLYVTEEHQSIWADRRDALLLPPKTLGFACRPFKTRPTMQQWKDYMHLLVEQVHKHQFDLIVIDTLSKMWPVREENDAGQVEEALMPFWDLCEAGVAVLLVHHSRKSGGEQFVGARGSGGLSAFCEILIEFGPTSDDTKETKRLLKCKGRYKECPDKLLAELTNGRYVGLGDPDTAETRVATKTFDWEEIVLDVLNSDGKWFSYPELESGIKSRRDGKAPRKNDVITWMGLKITGGEIERTGEGRRGCPYQYRVPYMGDE